MSLIDVTDSTFEEEVSKSKIPVVIDIWAPWCVSTDSIIMKDQKNEALATSISKGDSLLVYDGKKILQSKVLYSKTTSKGGHCKSITTESGRTIKVTDDHLFYTSKGWKRASELQPGFEVATYPNADFALFNEEANKKLIISEEVLIKMSKIDRINEKYIEKIKGKGLLPLTYDNPKLIIVARLVGALFSDGCLYKSEKHNYYNAEFFLGQKEDVEKLTSDLKELGFDFHVKKRINNFRIDGRPIKIRTFRIRVSSISFWFLMKLLGTPTGRKTNIDYAIPKWIMKAPEKIKKAFLSAYLGGDGPAIRIRVADRGKRGSYNAVNINDIEFYKAETMLSSALKFARQLSNLLEEQNITVMRIFVDAEKFERKSGGRSQSIHISLSSSFESAYALSSLGYTYSSRKQKQANYIRAFLAKKLYERNLWKEKYNKAKQMFNSKNSIKKIALELGVHESTLVGRVKGNKPTINKTFERYDAWLNNATKNLNGGLIWEKIGFLNDIYLPKVQILSIDKYSNFIANGFLVHNCGPCRFYGPIIDEVSKDYEGKIKFVKVNADENEKIVTKYNIQSIPTTLLVKNGELKAMNVGAVPKDTLKKWIEKNM